MSGCLDLMLAASSPSGCAGSVAHTRSPQAGRTLARCSSVKLASHHSGRSHRRSLDSHIDSILRHTDARHTQLRPARAQRSYSGATARTHQQRTCSASAASERPAHASGAEPARGELGLPTNFEERFAEGALLGVGSFGTVHLATCRTSGREVAVKKLRKDLPRGLHITRGTGRISRQKLLRRLRREIDTLRALDGCPSSIAFEGALETEGHVYLIMEVCHGGDLDTLLKACGALGERHAAMAVWEVLRLVRACHAAGILHGDIKPSNFMLAPGNPLCPVPLPPAASGRGKDTAASHRRDIAAEMAASRQQSAAAPATAAHPRQPPFCPLPDADATASDLRVPYAGGWLKGVDFGCSSEAPAGVPLTKMTGTPAFMAPEVFARNFGTQADMWSLGMLAYQTLSNRLPFWRDEDDMAMTSMTDVRSAVDEAIPLDYGPWLRSSPQCRDLVSRLLQHDTEQRLTAEQAAAHPWFALHGISASAAPAVPTVQSNILPAEDMAARAMLHRSPSSGDFAQQAV